MVYNIEKLFEKRVIMIFRKNIDRYCTYCRHAGKIDDDQMICSKKGIVSSGHHCKRFSYDPLKRLPVRLKPLSTNNYTEADFTL